MDVQIKLYHKPIFPYRTREVGCKWSFQHSTLVLAQAESIFNLMLNTAISGRAV